MQKKESSLSADPGELTSRSNGRRGARDFSTFALFLTKNLNHFFVVIYKVFGFALLAGLVFAMFAYLSVTTFYQLSRRWVLPEILTPQNEKVTRANLNYLDQKYQLQKIKLEKMDTESNLVLLKMQLTLKVNFENALSIALAEQRAKDADRAKELGTLAKKLAENLPQASITIENLTQEEKRSLNSARNSQLLDRHEILAREHFLDQLEVSSIDRQQKLSELNAELNKLKYSAGGGTSVERTKNLSIERVLREKELADSQMERLSIESRMAPLEKKLISLNELVQAYESSLENTHQSPFVQATLKSTTVAFLPYENVGKVSIGKSVYSCYLEFIFCSKVGVVKDIYAAESTGVHPLDGRTMRGKTIVLQLDKNSTAEERSLIVGRPPFLF